MASDPIDELERVARELSDADDWEEPTGRTDVHVHVERESHTPSTPPKSLAGWIKLTGAALGTGIMIGLGALLQQCGGRHP